MKIKTPDGFTLDAVFNRVPNSSKGVVFAHFEVIVQLQQAYPEHANPFFTLKWDKTIS